MKTFLRFESFPSTLVIMISWVRIKVLDFVSKLRKIYIVIVEK